MTAESREPVLDGRKHPDTPPPTDAFVRALAAMVRADIRERRRQRHYDARMRDREGAAKMAAIANLPIGWLFEDPRRDREDLILRATGPDGDEIEVSGRTAEEAWRAMAESLAAMGEGRLIPSVRHASSRP